MTGLENLRILVVDGDPADAERIERLLAKRFSAEVVKASDLRDARALLASGTFDLITLGYLFTDGTGLELLKEITARRNHPPVVMVTAMGDEEVASWSIRDGASDYVIKSDGMEPRLVEALKRAVEQGELRRTREVLEESEAFYRSLFHHTSEALFVETMDGRIEEPNEAACRLFGYTADELRGMTVGELVPPGRRGDIEGAIARLLSGDSVEFENMRRDRTVIPVSISASEVMTRRGPRYIVRVRDLTESKRTEKTLEREQAITARTLDTLQEIVVLFDREGRLLRWNRALNEVTGYTDEEIAGMSRADYHSVEDLARIEEAMLDVWRTGEPRMVEARLVVKDGRAIPYELSGALVREEDGRPFALVGLGRDASERQRSEETLRNMVMETNKRREEVTALLESTRAVLEHETFEASAAEVFSLCRELTGAEAGYVAVFGGKGPELAIVEPDSWRERLPGGGPMPVSTLHGTGFTTSQALIDNSPATSGLSSRIPDGHPAIENILLAPLVIGSKTAGMLALVNKPGGFDKHDGLVASAFSEIVSIALENSRNLRALRENEERFRAVVETVREAVICTDALGNITFWNPGAAAMFGYLADEMTGRPLTMLVPESEAREIRTLVERAAGAVSGAEQTCELAGLRKDGSGLFMELSWSTPWLEGDEIRLTAVIRDVTRRNEALEALAESEELHRGLMAASPDAIVVTDLGFKVTMVSNEAVLQQRAWGPEELIGLNAMDMLLPEDRARAEEELPGLLAAGVAPPAEFAIARRDGTSFVGEVNSSLLRDRAGELKAFIVVVRDVTERKRAEMELQMLNNELEGYAHAVSHDLRGPIAAIGAASETIRRILEGGLPGEAREDVAEMLEIIRNNVDRSNDLIDDLLDLAEAGQKPFDAAEVDINGVVSDVVASRAAYFESRKAEVRVEGDLGRVVASGTHMYQLFSNLIDNGIKHNNADRPVVSVRYHGTDESGGHRFTVNDNGPGIPADLSDKAFIPFVSGVRGGTGLGLSTVAKIVATYGGTITIREEGGACVEFLLHDFC